jgi:5-methylcytosine-specific restriction protein A
MPRARSICLEKGCVRVTVRAGRCQEHAPVQPSGWARTSARNRARDKGWERYVRPKVLARDGFACVFCGSRQGLELDHVIPVAKGGTWTEDNAQTLCQKCHRAKSVRERRT